MNKNQIIYIAPFQAAKILGVVGLMVGVVFVLFMFLLSQFGTRPWVTVPPVMFVTVPLFVGFFGFFFALVGCFMFNLVAKWLGGIEYVSTK